MGAREDIDSSYLKCVTMYLKMCVYYSIVIGKSFIFTYRKIVQLLKEKLTVRKVQLKELGYF